MSIGNKGILAATLLAAAAAPAMAHYTPIGTSGETSVFSILQSTYGAVTSITAAQFRDAQNNLGGQAFSTDSGRYDFVRIHDYFDTAAENEVKTNLHASYGGTTADQRFQDGVGTFKFINKFAGNTNRLGISTSYVDPLLNAHYTPILLGQTINATNVVPLGTDFQFALKVNDQSNNYYGSATDRGGAAQSFDHFVTWQVFDNVTNSRFYFLAVEDLNLGDADYNDWVGQFSVVPLPPAAWAGLTTLAGVGLFGFIRRRRQLA